MATLLSLFFSILLLLISISANGRSLQKNYTVENTDLSRSFSLATDTYTGKTNYNDVVGLMNICTQFTTLLEQNEDPCLPPKWSWIECNSDPKPRVTALNLNYKLQFGLLPDFSIMDALQRIDLSGNGLLGTIPSFFATFPDLQELNIANNFFYGLIPDSLACNNNLKLNVTGNSGLYTPDTCPTSTKNKSPTPTSNGSVQVPTTSTKKKSSTLRVILGSTISVFLLFWIAIGVFVIFRHRARTAVAIAQASAQEPKDISAEEMPMNARTNTTTTSP